MNKTIFFLSSFLCHLFVVNSFSQIIFDKQYGDTTFNERAYDLIETSDGEILMVGYKEDSTGWFSYFLKVNQAGEQQWEKSLFPTYDGIFDIQHSQDGNLLTLGYELSLGSPFVDLLVIQKIDEDANILWERKFNNSFPIRYYGGIAPTPDGGGLAVVTIGNNAGSGSEIKLFRFDVDGNLLWEKVHNFSQFGNRAYDVLPSPDGGFIISGQNKIQGGSTTAILFKVDQYGEIVWKKDYLPDPFVSRIYNCTRLQSGDYIAVGITTVKDTIQGENLTKSIWIKFDENGDTSWLKVNNVPTEIQNSSHGVVALDDGNFLVAGTWQEALIDRTIYLVLVNPDGEVICEYYSGEGLTPLAYRCIQTSDGGIAVACVSFSNNQSDIYLVKVDGVCNMTTSGLEKSTVKFNVFPNPCNEFLNLKYENLSTDQIFIEINLLEGKVIKAFKFLSQPKNSSLELDMSDLINGTYLISVRNAEGKIVGAQLFEKH